MQEPGTSPRGTWFARLLAAPRRRT